jgi:putative transcriptional regulator
MTVRFRLKELLGDRSRYALAKATGVSYPTISAMYHNKARGVTLDVLGKIADELGVDPGDLIERDSKRGGRKQSGGKASARLLSAQSIGSDGGGTGGDRT